MSLTGPNVIMPVVPPAISPRRGERVVRSCGERCVPEQDRRVRGDGPECVVQVVGRGCGQDGGGPAGRREVAAGEVEEGLGPGAVGAPVECGVRRRGAPVAHAEREEREREDAGLHPGHAGAGEVGGHGAVGVGGLGGVARSFCQPHGPESGGEDVNERGLVDGGEPLGGHDVPSRGVGVAAGRADLHLDQMAEDLEQREIMPCGEVDQLAGDHVAFAGAPRLLEGLHEAGVEREDECVGVAQVSGELFGFGCRLGGPAVPGSAMLQPDGREQTGAKRGWGRWAESVQRAPRDRDQGLGPSGIVGACPDGGDVVRRDHAGGEARVSGPFRFRGCRGALLLGQYQVGAACDRGRPGHGAHRAEPGVGPRRFRAREKAQPVLVAGRGREVRGVPEDVTFEVVETVHRFQSEPVQQAGSCGTQ